jgi:hypothetical protein
MMARAMRTTAPSGLRLASIASVVMIASLPALLGSAGCKSAKDKAAARAASTETPGELQLVDGGLILINEAGTVALGENTKIPDDFPKAIPVYPGARVNMAAHAPGGQGKGAWSLSLETGDDQPTVVAYYAKTMGASAGAFKKGSDLALGDTQMTVWQGAQYDVTLMISASPDSQTAITMTVAGK